MYDNRVSGWFGLYNKRKSIPNLASAGWISFPLRKANPPCGRLSFYTHFSTYVHFLQENTCYFLCSFLFYGQNLHFHLAKCSMPREGVAESPLKRGNSSGIYREYIFHSP